MTKWCYAVGNIEGGYAIYGPFDTLNAANRWWDQYSEKQGLDDGYGIPMDMQDPSTGLKESIHPPTSGVN